MRIAIIHHHLHPGGVTRVIESQVKSLQLTGGYELTVHTGDALQHLPAHGPGTAVLTCEQLQYLAGDLSDEQMREQFQKIILYLEQVAGKHDILHLHNPGLGKNPLLTLAISRLAEQGVNIVNHCHDFAEDRPGNYAFLKKVIGDVFGENPDKILYPAFRNYHFVVLTSKDYRRLSGFGIDAVRLNLVPNPVTFSPGSHKRISKEQIKEKLDLDRSLKLCLYPVRAIRRKNIGEFILLSVLFRDQASWLITQPPKNPVEIPEYDRWKEFCTANHIPVLFETGKAIDIHDLMPAADFCITTSTMEGFGLAYMEPWMAGIPVIGRNIDYCTADLKRNGIRFPLLYDQFIVSFKKEKTDFGSLGQEQQQQVIQDILMDPDSSREVVKLNPFLKDFLEPVNQEIVQNNQQVIQERYSLESYGRQLHGIYKKFPGRA